MVEPEEGSSGPPLTREAVHWLVKEAVAAALRGVDRSSGSSETGGVPAGTLEWTPRVSKWGECLAGVGSHGGSTTGCCS